MVSFPNCKINLGLRVISKRDDGFHNLETVFYPVSVFDALEIIVSKGSGLQVYGNSIPGQLHENIVLKAYQLLRQDFNNIPDVKIALLKNIPSGAGLGGGSANAAFMLKMLNSYFDLQLNSEQLMQYALKLGSDCPFFILNKPASAHGRGEILKQVNLNLSEYNILIVNPGIHISTATAFSKIKPQTAIKTVSQIVKQPLATWKNELINDFEKPVFELYPEIYNIKDSLYKTGAVYSSLSGSGSSVYGIFPKKISLQNYLPASANYRVYIGDTAYKL